MIEVKNIQPVNKGCVLCTCSIHIKPWQLTMHEVRVFEKGANRWIGMPSREKGVGVEKSYVELLTFDSDAVKNKFRDQIMTAIDKYLVENPDMKMPDVITLDAECPF